MTFKKITAYIAAAALTVTALFSLSSCGGSSSDDGKKGLNGWFTSVISGSPATLDPQTCTGDDAEQIVANVFRGLYRHDDGGKVVPAMAESVSVSDDGLVYKFKLSENVKWYGKDDFSAECTAEDFVFAFRRLVDPAMRSERAPEYYCIKNAKEINTRKITDLKQLGVEATGKYELTITLAEPCADFEYLLAAAPAMPCNSEYYELTEGQYGLVGDCIGSNGYFYVSRWHYDKWVRDGNFIELKRNALNAEALGTAPRGVTFMINANGYESFLDGRTDVYCTAVPDEITRLSGRYEVRSCPKSVWGVVFNSRGAFDSTDLRIALGGFVNGVSGDVYSPADCIVPSDASSGEYRENAGVPTKSQYSENELIERGTRAVRELGDGALTGMKLLIPEGTALRQGIGTVIQQWQKNFGVYCMIEELPYPDYISALENGNFEAAMVRLGGNDPLTFLSAFSSLSQKNYGGVSSRKLDDILASAHTAKDSKSAAKYLLEAEQLILDSGWFVPFCFETGQIFLASGAGGIVYDPSFGGYIFGNAVKK